jgi:multimeric flavodoxin WrbA
MIKVLGVIGSPRKHGNTHILVSQLLDGAMADGADVSTVFLGDLRIKECDGCHVCWDGNPCCKDDDMPELYERIIESDVIVLGTPVYWYGPTALMKGFVDRLVYFNCPENRAKIRGKSAVIVVPFEDESYETSRPLEKFFEKSLAYLEIKFAGKLIVPGVSAKGDVTKKPEKLQESFKLGQRLVRGDL